MKTKIGTIWKFTLIGNKKNPIQMPIGAEILSVQFQDDKICIWALVDPYEPKEETRTFVLIGTGDFITEQSLKYIATLQFPKAFGHFNQVYHLFEY